MKINPNIFRGYDLRGIVGSDLNPAIMETIGKAYGTYLKRHNIKEALVGRDCRASSPSYSKAIAKGLLWAGIDVTNIGMNLIGTFYWSQYFLKIKGGVFVTASHNPPEFNGLKLAIDYSETLVSEGMQELRKMVENDDYEKGSVSGKLVEKDVRQEYFKDILSRVPIKKKFRVVVDPSSSTAGEIAPELLRKAGMEVVEKNCKVDPSFPQGQADPTDKKVADRLSREVVESKADVGFSYDADGDRIGIVDDKGGIIWNDLLVSLFALDVLRDHKGETIMYNTLCSRTVKETIVKAGGVPFMWRTGHSFLKKKNQEVHAAFIGELSGHFFFSRDFYNHDDGLYSTLRLLKYLSETGKPLSETISELPKYISSPEIKLFCSDAEKVLLLKKITPILRKDFPEAEITENERAGDGVRLDMNDSMFVVRYSQNGPYITIKFESKTENDYDKLKRYLIDLLHKYSEIDWHSDINVNEGELTA